MRRHKTRIFLVISLLSFLSFPFSSLADLGQTNLRMTATLVANSCTISNDSKNKTIEMGTWSTKQFTALSRESTPVPFIIKLENCNSESLGISVTFNGTHDIADNTLLALNSTSSAKNIAIAILDSNRRKIPLGRPSGIQKWDKNNHTAELNFYGQYIATATPVLPGTADADATFTVEYH